MKIGILTLPQETNYGGILQAFALQRTLIKMGHDAITIDRHNCKEYPSIKIHIAGFCKRLFQHYLQGKRNVSTKWNPFISADEYKSASAETQKFIDRNLRLTKRVFSNQLDEIEKEYQFDAYIVGSDQVWLDYYCPASFLDFVKRKDVKRVTYAASCGQKSFFKNAAKVSQCRDFAKLFNGISVREAQLIEKCKEYLGIDVQWVLDPTLLLNPSEYLDATRPDIIDKEPVLFSYILDSNEDIKVIVNTIANKLNLPIVNGNRIHEIGNAGKVYPSVDSWLQNINRARFVITDSFHGTVFSILFNKPFLSIGNYGRGIERFQSLLERFELDDRLFTNIDLESILLKVNTNIDFERVNRIINEERVKSFEFLQKSLA